MCEGHPSLLRAGPAGWLALLVLAGALQALSCRQGGVSAAVDLTPHERQWLEAHRDELVFAPDPFYAPFEFFDPKDGMPTGLAHDYMRLIEKKLGVRFKILRAGSFAEILSLARDRKVAIVNAATKTPERSQYLLFTAPFVEVPNVILVRHAVEGDVALEDLTDKKVSLVSGYAVAEHIVARQPRIRCDYVSTDLSALLHVAFGISEAAVVDVATSSYITERDGISNLRVAGDVGYPVRLAIGSRSDWPELNGILNKALASVSAAEREAIYHRWIHIENDTLLASRGLRIALLSIIGVLLAGGGAIFLWNVQLKRQVAIRTTDLLLALERLKASEERLLQHRLHLEELVAERTDKLNRSNAQLVQEVENRKRTAAELKRSNDELEQFAYVASHDLREPLRKMAGFSQLLSERYKDRLDADANQYIAFIVDGARRMQEMITDIMSCARVLTGERRLAPVDCGAVLERIISSLEPAIAESGAVVTRDALPTVPGDESQLAQLLQNLLGNAIKFRGPKPPRIHVSAVRQDREWVFSVRDEGIGIDPADFERIFEIFTRLHTREQYAGAGIGLAICKRIVERHGGRIWVESQRGAGSTFLFSLPA